MCLHAGMDIEMPSCTGYNEKIERDVFKWKLDIHILDTGGFAGSGGKIQNGLI